MIAYRGCPLVALDKCPDVRPIGISEVMRRITGRIIVDCIRQDLTSLIGNMQLCRPEMRHRTCHTFASPVLMIPKTKQFYAHLCMLPYRIPIATRLISTSVSRPFCLRKIRHKVIPLQWECMESQSYFTITP